ncbi:DeoR/GlpR family DNA-binding transcription regulator [Plantibacter flavus]|uniref:DeoR/GlpR family DNA-binding transcription regulator n=1 Tax=Plantibacter flavus TaxID=150123 RepID=UPI003F180738
MSASTEPPAVRPVDERRLRILALLDDAGRVEVAALSASLGVTEETIRRDLRALEDDGLLERAHGGAVRVSEDAAGDRGATQAARAVATAAAALVAPGAQILLGGGAACEALAAHLADRPDLTVFTSSIPVAVAAALAEAAGTVHSIGGTVDERGSLTGAWARGRLDDLRVDVAFVTANGLRADGRLLHRTPEDAALTTAMTRAARSTVLLGDPLVDESPGATASVALSTVAAAVLGRDASESTVSMLEEAGARVHHVPGEDEDADERREAGATV